MTTGRPIGEDDLHAHLDGRLPPGREAEVREHLARHPVDAARLAAYAAQRAALRSWLRPRGDEPIRRHLRVEALLVRRRRARTRQVAGVAAGLALLLAGGAAGWIARDPAPAPPSTGRTAREAGLPADAMAAHALFAADVRHPVEVTAAQQDHLVQWLSHRLGRRLRAPDLSAQGLRLMGGRLLPSEGLPAAQFMYEDASGARLTLYARAGPADRATSFQIVERDGLAGFYWVDGGFGYALVARMAGDRLWPVVQAVHRQLSGGSQG